MNTYKTKSITAMLMAAALMASCSQKETARTKAPTRVTTETVATDINAGESRTYVGVVEENAATAVSFTSMGTVSRVLVSEGQAVSAGQLLAEMDDTQARNLLEGAQAQLAQAEDALSRYSQLHDQGSLPEVQWVEIQSKVAQARSQLAIAQKNMADCRLVAPVSGIIGRKAVGAGETALPSQAVVTILDISQVKVRFAVPEGDMAGITPRTPTQIEVEAIGETLAGGEIEKGVQADALTHTYDIRARVINKDRRLLPGMVATVSISGQGGGTQAASPTVPLTAVQRRPDGSLFVWTIGPDSTARRTAVTLGDPRGSRVVVTTGLNEGQSVVTEGYQKLSEGTKVAENNG